MKQKRLDFEALRLLAIFGVVFNHSQARGFELYMLEDVSRVNYLASLLLGILCKTAVPLFFLVSGGLLLHREESIGVTLKKRALRIAVALVLFSGILYLRWILWGYVPAPGFGDFLQRFWSEGISAPYWYLYTYLGLVLMLPLLRPMVQHMSDQAFVYLAILHMIVYGLCAIPGLLTGWGPLNSDFLLPMAEPEVFYFLMGYYLAHRFPWERMDRKRLGLLWLLAAAAVACMLWMADLYIRYTGTSNIGYHNGWMLFPIFAIYASAQRFFASHVVPDHAAKILTALGGCVFGTYLMEGMLRHDLSPIYFLLEPRIHVLPACLIWVVLVVLCGLCITWVLKKIPLLNRIL